MIPSKKVLTRPDFLGTSVSSEHWVPMEEVPPADLPQWLQQHKDEGWRLVGVEQTGVRGLARAPSALQGGGAGAGVESPVLGAVGSCWRLLCPEGWGAWVGG